MYCTSSIYDIDLAKFTKQSNYEMRYKMYMHSMKLHSTREGNEINNYYDKTIVYKGLYDLNGE